MARPDRPPTYEPRMYHGLSLPTINTPSVHPSPEPALVSSIVDFRLEFGLGDENGAERYVEECSAGCATPAPAMSAAGPSDRGLGPLKRSAPTCPPLMVSRLLFKEIARRKRCEP
jgi:hypothetical protein